MQLHEKRNRDSANPRTIARVFEIFEEFSDCKRPLTSMQLSKKLKYPYSSTRVILQNLSSLGYLVFNEESRTYFPTARLSIIGDWITGSTHGLPNLTPLMKDLSRQAKETVTLSVLNGVRMQTVHCIRGPHPISFSISPGASVPIEGSGIGAAAISILDDYEIEQLQVKINQYREAQGKELLAEGTLARSAEAVRALGYSAGYNQYHKNTGGVSIHFPVQQTETIYVIAVGGPVDRIRPQEKALARLLVRSVRQFNQVF